MAQPFGARVRSTIDRWFKDRQILVRTDGTVHYWTVPRRTQMAAAGAVAVTAAYLLASTVGMAWQQARVIDRDAELTQANLAYTALLQETSTVQQRYLAVAQELEAEHAQVVALLTERGALTRDLARLSSTAEDREQRAALAQRLDEIEARLTVAYNLDNNVDRLGDLAALATPGTIHDASDALDELGTILGKVDTRVSHETVNRYWRAAEVKLAAALDERDAALARAEELTDRFMETERQMAALRSAQRSFLEQLKERTGEQITQLEATVTGTGLDVDVLLERFDDSTLGMGGPFHSLRASALGAIAGDPLSDVTDHHLGELESRLEQWVSLHGLMGQLPLASPVDHYYVSSNFGRRVDPFTKKWAMHEGIDMAAPRKTPILAAAPGTVTFVGRRGAYGRLVEIDHGNGITTRYGHLHQALVKKGQTVGFRDRIGLMGSTGRSTGSHLHYEVLFDGEQIDPAPFIRAGRYLFKEG